MLQKMQKARQFTVEELVADLVDTSKSTSIGAAESLINGCKDLGMSPKDFLRFSVNPLKGDFAKSLNGDHGMDGYEMALAYLNLPVKNDVANGVLLKAAENTFKTYEGVRALFPSVLDDIVQWKMKFVNSTTVADMVSQTRTIDAKELISTVIEDAAADYAVATVSEGARIPVHTIKAAEQTVAIYKHGAGYEFTYEVARRMNIELFIPYLARLQRKLEESKVTAMTSILVNGDNSGYTDHGATPTWDQETDGGFAADQGLLYKGFLKFLSYAHQQGKMIDTVAGNYAAFYEWNNLFLPVTSGIGGNPEAMKQAGAGPTMSPGKGVYDNPIKFVLAPDMADNTLQGFVKGETLEELVESNSAIEESEASIRTQKVTVVRTENSGGRLVFGDTRLSMTWDEED